MNHTHTQQQNMQNTYVLSVDEKFYLNIRGGTLHRCHSSVCTTVRWSRFDTISVQQEKK